MVQGSKDAGSGRPWWARLIPILHSHQSGEYSKEEADQAFLLQVIQPALVGLMDGSVSTLAPIFASAYATHHAHTAFLIGVAAAVGAGISMGFAEALSDTGELTGRGNPIQRGVITGGATFFGGILHTLPFLLPSIQLALIVAYFVVGFELITISVIRFKFFDMPITKSVIQVVIGGALVFLAGFLIGSS